MSDLDQILSDEPVQDVPAEEPKEAPEGEVEQEAPEGESLEAEEAPEVTEEEPVEAKAEPTESEKGLLAALTAMRAELRELKAKPEPEPVKLPDVIDDPNGYAQTLQSQFQHQLQNERLNMSEAISREKHGDDVINAAMEAIKASGDQATHQQILANPMPYEALVKWHKQQQFQQQVGSDPEAFMAKERERIKAEVMAEIEAKQTAQAIKAPPSLAAQTSIGGRNTSAAPTQTPLDDIL